MVVGEKGRLQLLSFPAGSRAQSPGQDWQRDDALFVELFRQLDQYFAGKLRQFDLSLELKGTSFQKKVWQALGDIPYGETTSYGTLASRLGDPKKSRAVGTANGQNPLPIIIPCHRVIGADGSLTGFGGGLETKRFLLDHERRHAPDRLVQGELAL